MSKITYLKGDATQPIGDGRKIICHICNNIGAWGAGFVLALSKRWKQPEESYRALFAPDAPEADRMLGSVTLIDVGNDRFGNNILVANMIAQSGIKSFSGIPPIRYGAVRAALAEVNNFAYSHHCTLHMPRIGCGLAGGSWEEIEAILKDVMSVDVFVYDFK